MAEILHFVQNDRRRVQNDKHGISLITAQSPGGGMILAGVELGDRNGLNRGYENPPDLTGAEEEEGGGFPLQAEFPKPPLCGRGYSS